MPSFCQLGQKAYVYADGGPFKFDGPIDVELSQESFDIFYPNVWYHEWEFRSTYCVNRFVGWQYTINPIMKFYTRDSTAQRSYVRGYMYNGNPGGWYNLSSNYGSWLSVSADRNLYFDSATHYPCDIENGATPYPPTFVRVLKTEKVNHSSNAIPGETTYKLKVNGATIKTSSAPIAYSVKCGDRCPPGEKWDPVSRSCCCENMPSLIAQVRGAVNIAREIKP
jgi:hypothetical protein